MVEAKEAGERTGPIAGEQSGDIVGIDEVHRSGRGAHIEYTEHSGLEREFPLATQGGGITVEGKRFTEIGRAGIPRPHAR